MIRIISPVDPAVSVCSCERRGLGNYKSYRGEISDLDSLASYAVQVCYAYVPRP